MDAVSPLVALGRDFIGLFMNYIYMITMSGKMQITWYVLGLSGEAHILLMKQFVETTSGSRRASGLSMCLRCVGLVFS